MDEKLFFGIKTGFEFEEKMVTVLRFCKLDANRVGRNDGGVDIIATFTAENKKQYTFYIQCKFQNATVGKHPVQEVYTGRDYYDKDRTAYPVVITNNYMTLETRCYAKKLGVEVITATEWLALKKMSVCSELS